MVVLAVMFPTRTRLRAQCTGQHKETSSSFDRNAHPKSPGRPAIIESSNAKLPLPGSWGQSPLNISLILSPGPRPPNFRRPGVWNLLGSE